MAITINSYTPNTSPVTAPEQTTITLEVNATESNGVALLYQWETSTNWDSTSQTGSWTAVSGATTDSYTTPPLTSADDNKFYRVRVYTLSPSQQVYAPSVNGVELNVVPPTIILITTPAETQYSVSAGSTLTMVVQSTLSSEESATSSSAVNDISYQWQKKESGNTTWNNVSSSSLIAITTETILEQLTPSVTQYYRRSTLIYSGVPFSENLDEYRVIITSSIGSNSPLTSTSTTIIVGATLSIQKQPGVVAGLPGYVYVPPDLPTSKPGAYDDNAVIIYKYNPADVISIDVNNTYYPGRTILTVDASSTAGSFSTLTYLWQYQTSLDGEWQEISVSSQGIFTAYNYDTFSLLVTETQFTNYLKFRCIISGTANEPSLTSAEVTMSIWQRVVMMTNPFPTTIAEGQTANFTAEIDTSTYATQGIVNTKWQRKNPGSSTWSDVTLYAENTQPIYTTPVLNAQIDNGAYYRLQVDGQNCTNEPFFSPTQDGVLLSVYSFVSITTQPATSSVYNNQVASFALTSASTNSASLNYQWQVRANNQATWSNLNNSDIYTGVNTNILIINPATIGLNNYRYRCVVDAPGTISSVTSDEAYLYVFADNFTSIASINDQYLLQGQALEYTGNAQSASLSAVSYQWQFKYSSASTDWINIPGATNAVFTVPSVTAANSGYYRYLVISFGDVLAYSNTASVSVTQLNINVVSNNPSTVTVLEGVENSLSLSVTATPSINSDLTYEWQYNTNPIGSAGWAPFSTGFGGSSPATNTYTPLAFFRSQSGLRVRCAVVGTGIPGTWYSSEVIINVNRRLTYVPIPVTISIAPNEFQTIDLAPTYTGGTISYQWQYRSSSSGSWTDITGYTTQNLNIIGYSASQLPTAGSFVVNSGMQIRCLVTLTDATQYQFFTSLTGLSVNTISPAGSQIIVNKNVSPDLTSTVNIISSTSLNVQYSVQSAKTGAAIGTIMCIPKTANYSDPGPTGGDDCMAWSVPHPLVQSLSNTEKLKYDFRFVGWLPITASPLMSSSNNNNGAMLNAAEFPELARIMGNTFGGSINVSVATAGFLPPKTGTDGNSGGLSGNFGLPLVYGKKLMGTGSVNNNAASVAVVARFDGVGNSGSLNAVGYIGGAYNYYESEQLPAQSGGTAGTSTINPSTFTLGSFTTTGWADAQADIQTSYRESINYSVGPLSTKTFTTPTVHSHQMTSYTQLAPSSAQQIGRWSAVGTNNSCVEINADSGEQVAGVPYIGTTVGHTHGITAGDASAEGIGHGEDTGGLPSTFSGQINQSETGSFLTNGALIMSQQSNSLWNSALSFTLRNADKMRINTPHFRLKYYIKSW